MLKPGPAFVILSSMALSINRSGGGIRSPGNGP
ncbi:hypothetical protein SFHH103_00966 [Sinorhizobium fredii HH103]|uniref:Uncharacterized protein n=1 Tax=Sinorhizobium fredii (strain HH103) TaxID=1117943 RepID=G9A409_SINF1|nr:hypothetical protein SFHH103_00966 [Sinorhizobium fredii HH103]